MIDETEQLRRERIAEAIPLRRRPPWVLVVRMPRLARRADAHARHPAAVEVDEVEPAPTVDQHVAVLQIAVGDLGALQ